MYTMNVKNGISLSAATIQGARSEQQDFYVSSQLSDRTIAIVCDGMGGMNGGSVASRHAAQMLLADFERVNPGEDMYPFFKAELEKLDDAVWGLKNADGTRMGAGTTLVSVVLFGNRLFWFSVGDSKLFYVRKREMHCVTREHNYALRLQEMYQNHSIDEAKYREESAKGEQLISYLGLGMAEVFDGNYSPFFMEQGDKILLCTDGVYRTLPETEIQTILQKPGSTETLCRMIEEAILAKQKKNQDNATWMILQRIGETRYE